MQSDIIMRMQSEYARLETATDAGRMRGPIEEELRRRLGDSLRIREFWVTRVFPRHNGRFVVQYEINFESSSRGDSGKVYFCAALMGPEEEWPWYVRPDNEKVVIFDHMRMFMPVFPFDPKIKYLSEIVDSLKCQLPDGTRKALPSSVAGSRIVTGFEILGYRLERRCVARCSLVERTADAGGSQPTYLILKIFRPGRALDPVRRLQRLLNNGFDRQGSLRLTVPEVLYYDDDKGLAIMENAPGDSPHLLLGESSFEDACRMSAILLSKLHALEPVDAGRYSMTDELETLQEKIELCGNVFPSIGERLLAVYSKLTSSGKYLDEKMLATVHGDFHDKQVLYSAEMSTLLDCDNMKNADPALDYGNFMAHLILRRIQFPELAGNIEKGEMAFVRAYKNKSGRFEKRALWWMAAALLRLAVIYSLRPRWRALTPEIINAAHILEKRTTKHGGVDAIYPI